MFLFAGLSTGTTRLCKSVTLYTSDPSHDIRDPALHSEPEEFRPERHLDATQKIDVSPPDTHNLGHATFGFGRR